MAHEIDAAALDSLKSVIGRTPPHNALPLGSPCPNCGTELVGPWCAACGQSAEDYHRSLLRLATEAVEGLFDLDGRLWRTLPSLCVRPGRLTRSFLDGHRVSQVPPFRLFLVVIVLVFLVASFEPHSGDTVVHLGGPQTVTTGTPTFVAEDLNVEGHSATTKWVSARLAAVAKSPQRFQATMMEWAQRLAVLFLPVSAALLGLMFFWRRGVYMFDHLIFSMPSLSFQGLLLSLTMLASNLNDGFGWLLALAPVHLFAHLKGAYGLGVFGTLIRMIVLLFGSLVALLFALAGLTMIGLYEATP